jgi:hypothetical protein
MAKGSFRKFDPNAELNDKRDAEHALLKKVANLERDIRKQRISREIQEDYQYNDMGKLLAPVTNANLAIAEKQQPFLEQSYYTRKEIESQKPILQQLLNEATTSNYQMAKAIEGQRAKIHNVSDFVARALGSRNDDSGLAIKPDTRLGASPLDFTIGTKTITFQGNELYMDDESYDATPGLMKLLTRKEYDGSANEYDIQSYLDIVKKSKAYRQNPTAQNSRPLSSQSSKWTLIVGPWYKDTVAKSKSPDKQGQGLIDNNSVSNLPAMIYNFLPSDPNALVERLDLLFKSQEAGNTGNFNEIMAIIQFLYNNKHIRKRRYDELMLRARIT